MCGCVYMNPDPQVIDPQAIYYDNFDPDQRGWHLTIDVFDNTWFDEEEQIPLSRSGFYTYFNWVSLASTTPWLIPTGRREFCYYCHRHTYCWENCLAFRGVRRFSDRRVHLFHRSVCLCRHCYTLAQSIHCGLFRCKL